MPLEGFRVLDWASTTFGGLPPMFLGGLGLAVLIAGVVIAVTGIRLSPTSYALIAAGGAMAVLTYFIIGAAVAATHSDVAGTTEVAGAAPRIVPWAVALVPVGLGLFGFRAALRLWSGEDLGQKVGAVLLVLVSALGVLVGVQVVRGSLYPGGAQTHTDDTQDDSGDDDGTDHPGHGVSGRTHR